MAQHLQFENSFGKLFFDGIVSFSLKNVDLVSFGFLLVDWLVLLDDLRINHCVSWQMVD